MNTYKELLEEAINSCKTLGSKPKKIAYNETITNKEVAVYIKWGDKTTYKNTFNITSNNSKELENIRKHIVQDLIIKGGLFVKNVVCI